MFQILDCGNTGTMLPLLKSEGAQPAPVANMATAFQNPVSQATSLSAIFGFGELYADLLSFFKAFSHYSGMRSATKFWWLYIFGAGTPLRPASGDWDSPDAVPHQPQPDLGDGEAEGAVPREAATITCHVMS